MHVLSICCCFASLALQTIALGTDHLLLQSNLSKLSARSARRTGKLRQAGMEFTSVRKVPGSRCFGRRRGWPHGSLEGRGGMVRPKPSPVSAKREANACKKTEKRSKNDQKERMFSKMRRWLRSKKDQVKEAESEARAMQITCIYRRIPQEEACWTEKTTTLKVPPVCSQSVGVVQLVVCERFRQRREIRTSGALVGGRRCEWRVHPRRVGEVSGQGPQVSPKTRLVCVTLRPENWF